jgi:hypothetical protein
MCSRWYFYLDEGTFSLVRKLACTSELESCPSTVYLLVRKLACTSELESCQSKVYLLVRKLACTSELESWPNTVYLLERKLACTSEPASCPNTVYPLLRPVLPDQFRQRCRTKRSNLTSQGGRSAWCWHPRLVKNSVVSRPGKVLTVVRNGPTRDRRIIINISRDLLQYYVGLHTKADVGPCVWHGTVSTEYSHSV